LKKCSIGVTQYRNNVDIKIKLIRYDPNGVPNFFFLNSATCIFTVLYDVIENWYRNTQSVRNKVIHKNYVFSVTSRSRTFRFGRNKELVLTNKQKQFCKNLMFLRDSQEKCFLCYREPATPGYIIYI
jgi:hypothetical protein